MSFRHLPLRKFASDEFGAVSVDYVVLTAGACGLMLVFSDTIMEAFGVFSGTVEGELSGRTVAGYDGTLTYDDGFDNGAEGWTGATASHVHGAGNVLGPMGGSNGEQSVSKEFDLAGNGEPATFTFDLMSFDGLDGESSNVYVDGNIVGTVTTTNGDSYFTAIGSDPSIEVSGVVTDNQTQIGGNSLDPNAGMDSRTQVTITMNDPQNDTVTIGFGSTADGSVETESFAVDNFTATGLNNPDAPAQSNDATSNYSDGIVAATG